MSTVLVITHLPDTTSATTLAAALLDANLAACVNIQPPCQSMYRWQGKLEQASEVALHIKTRTQHYAAVEALIQSQHPYELPDIIAVPITHGLPAYLEWVKTETTPDVATGI